MERPDGLPAHRAAPRTAASGLHDNVSKTRAPRLPARVALDDAVVCHQAEVVKGFRRQDPVRVVTGDINVCSHGVAPLALTPAAAPAPGAEMIPARLALPPVEVRSGRIG